MTRKSKVLEIAEIYLSIHLTEKRIALEYPKGEMRCPVHLSLGQEIFPAILGSLMRTEDLALSSHRSHAHYLAKRGSITSFIAEIYGKSSGCCRGRGGSMHLIDLDKNFLGSTAIVANSIPVAVGSAASLKINNPKSEALCFIFFGDGAVEEGVFSESLNIASLQSLPTVFVCENNAFSVYTHLSERQPPNRKIYELAAGFGMRSELIDISNIGNCLRQVSGLLDWARRSKKPLFIEVPSWLPK
jgi:pyruvate dehydrogenase E1 component alpha subunit